MLLLLLLFTPPCRFPFVACASSGTVNMSLAETFAFLVRNYSCKAYLNVASRLSNIAQTLESREAAADDANAILAGL